MMAGTGGTVAAAAVAAIIAGRAATGVMTGTEDAAAAAMEIAGVIPTGDPLPACPLPELLPLWAVVEFCLRRLVDDRPPVAAAADHREDKSSLKISSRFAPLACVKNGCKIRTRRNY